MIMMGDKKKHVNMILGPADEEKQPESINELEALADEVLIAIEAKDSAALTDALRAFFTTCDAQPHVEGEHKGE